MSKFAIVYVRPTGTPIRIRCGLLRRLGLRRTPWATPLEVVRWTTRGARRR